MEKIIILIPVYNDWKSVSKLIDEINFKVSELKFTFSILIINDASTEQQFIYAPNQENLDFIKIINMKENKGHSRCIATGLKHIFENEEFDYVIPMDGDGEDRPEEISDFVEHINYDPNKAIVGERVKRSESIFFKICYEFHKVLTFIFTGKSIKFGNFTCLPKLTVEKMINEKASWSSFSGALTKIETDRSVIPSKRGARYFGPSKMSFTNLILHSLSIISVFKINVLLRAILFLIVYIFLIHQNISFITLVPVLFVVLLLIPLFSISQRENLDEIKNSLLNISNIEKLK